MNSVYKLLIQIIGKDKGATRELKKTKRAAKGLGDQVKLLKGAFAAAGATMAVHFARQMAETVWEMGKVGAEALRMESSFDDLAGRIDVSGKSLLASLKTASGGTVSDMEIMRTTAGLLASGIQTSTGDMVDAMEIARLKAQQFGITTTEAYNRMVTGARKFSVEMLDEIGINLKAESVYRRRAAAMGVAVSALTDAQRAEALWTAILEDGRAEIEEYGGAVDDMATDIERATVAIENAKLAASTALAPMVGELAAMIPGAIARLELIGAALEGIISFTELGTAAAEAQRIEQERGIVAAESYIKQVIRTGGEVEFAADVHGDWLNALGQLPGTLAMAGTALDGHAEDVTRVARAYIAAGSEYRKWYSGRMTADIAAMDPYESGNQEAALEAIDKQREGNATREADRAAEYERVWRDAISEQERAYNELRSAVESALTPTVVTDYDLGLAEMGEYVDKWDENARRLDAIAERGFAELEAHPDWAEILGIPANVLMMGEDALKSWARQTGAAVRDLTRPDLLNVDAAVAAVEQYFADMAARELSIDIITQALIEKGVVAGPGAKEQVAQALGLDQTTIGEETGAQIFDGMIEKFSEKSAASEFAGYLKEDTINQAVVLRGAGRELWLTTEVGILEAMEEGTYVLKWVEILLPALVTALSGQGQWSGEGEP